MERPVGGTTPHYSLTMSWIDHCAETNESCTKEDTARMTRQARVDVRTVSFSSFHQIKADAAAGGKGPRMLLSFQLV